MSQYSFERLRDGYEQLWADMEVVKVAAANAQARKVLANKARYLAIECRTDVPWFVIGCLHMRESGGDFSTYLGNGQPLNRRTTIVPKGRGPWTGPTAFEDGAYDALVTVERLNEITEWSAAHVAYAMEKFNGFGYRHPSRNIPSPYLWGGTTAQKRGKFVRDGVYDPTVMDSQIGGMAVLKQIMALDLSAKFKAKPKSDEPAPPLAPADPAPSPKAIEKESQVKPVERTQTLWGNIAQGAASVFAAVAGALAGVPWQVWVVLIVVTAIGFYMVARGHVDLRNIVRHLASEDDEER